MVQMTQPLPKKLYTADQSKRIDRAWVAQGHVSGYQLMCRAGEVLLTRLQETWSAAATICVLAGSGNNAGDGYVLARLALAKGYRVCVVYSVSPDRLTGEALQAAQAAKAAAVVCEPWAGQLPNADVYVDALLGIGFAPKSEGLLALSSPVAEMIEALNISGVPVLAVDIPSGLHADRGKLANPAVQADVTVTFITTKPGLLTGPAVDWVGDLWWADLGVPQSVLREFPSRVTRLETSDLVDLKSALTARPRSSHKGHFGHAVVVGGDLGLGGAALLAAEAALLCGAGKVSVLTRAEHVAAVLARLPEVMALAVSYEQPDSMVRAKAVMSQASVVVLGPGLGTHTWGVMLAQEVLASAQPLIVDADALMLLAQDQLGQVRGPWVMTPHPKEAARLLGVSVEEVEQDRFAAVEQLHTRFGAHAVLKGAGSLVCTGADSMYLIDAGNPSMATGGMGDVLCGVIAALVAQKVPLNQAAVMGALWHAVAGDRAALRLGRVGVRASEVALSARDYLKDSV